MDLPQLMQNFVSAVGRRRARTGGARGLDAGFMAFIMVWAMVRPAPKTDSDPGRAAAFVRGRDGDGLGDFDTA